MIKEISYNKKPQVKKLFCQPSFLQDNKKQTKLCFVTATSSSHTQEPEITFPSTDRNQDDPQLSFHPLLSSTPTNDTSSILAPDTPSQYYNN